MFFGHYDEKKPMKWGIISTFLFVIFVVLGLFKYLYQYPYQIYQDIVRQKDGHNYFPIDGPGPHITTGSILQLNEKKILKTNIDKYWQSFHFENYQLPIPIANPLFTLIPKIKMQRKQSSPLLGFDLTNQSFRPQLSFMSLKPIKFNFIHYNSRTPKVFSLPAFSAILEKRKYRNIWDDLFSKNIKNDNVPLEELLYNLYLLHLRKVYLPNQTQKISLYLDTKDKNKLGVIQLKSNKRGLKKEQVWHLVGHKVHRFEIEYIDDNWSAYNVRKRFLSSIVFKERNANDAKLLYLKFQQLPYYQKISEVGLAYLYSGFTHRPTDKKYLKEMINFLERGRDNLHYLRPLYSYAYRQFNETFSKNSAMGKLLGNIAKEEDQNEYNRSPGGHKEFESLEAKIDYYLKEAKNSKINSDLNESSIRIE